MNLVLFPLRWRNFGSDALLFALICANSASAASVTLTPTEDTFISAHWTEPNGSGFDMVIGTQGVLADFSPNRALIKFDFSAIPAGAQIDSVSLQMTVTKSPPGPISTKQLHRLLRDWSEAGSTWVLRTGSESWGEPGGEAGVDYVASVSGSAQFGTSLQPYTFASTPGMIADVAGWVANPAGNHGWLVKTADESSALTARRIGSSEGSFPPRLTINYTASPPRPVINSAALNNGQLCVGFTATAGRSYVLERRAAVNSGSWIQVATLPPPGSTGPATLCDPVAAGNAFYRIGVL